MTNMQDIGRVSNEDFAALHKRRRWFNLPTLLAFAVAVGAGITGTEHFLEGKHPERITLDEAVLRLSLSPQREWEQRQLISAVYHGMSRGVDTLEKWASRSDYAGYAASVYLGHTTKRLGDAVRRLAEDPEAPQLKTIMTAVDNFKKAF